MTENEIATQIVDAALKVHEALGPCLLETVYEGPLEYELRDRGLDVGGRYRSQCATSECEPR